MGKILKLAAPIVGTALGGPMGGMIGGAVGSMFGGKPKFGNANAAINQNLPGQSPAELKAQQDRINSYLTQFGNRPAPTMTAAGPIDAAQIDRTNVDQIQGQQQGLANFFQGQVAGTQPSIAQTQLGQSLQGNLANQAAATAGARGPNAALAHRMVMQQGGNMAQQAAGQGALLRLQEQEAGAQNLGGVLGQMQDPNLAIALNQAQLGQQAGIFNAGNQQQANAANLNANLQNQGMSQEAILQLLAQSGQLNQNAAQNVLGLNQQGLSATGMNNAAAQQSYQNDVGQQEALGNMFAGAASMGKGGFGGILGGMFNKRPNVSAFLNQYPAVSRGGNPNYIPPSRMPTPGGASFVS